MTPFRFRTILLLLDWSQRSLADRLSCSEGLVRKWANGEAPVPEPIGDWLEVLAATHTAHPPPESGFRRPPGPARSEG